MFKNIWICFAIKVLLKSVLFLPQLKKKMEGGVTKFQHYFKGQFYTIQYKNPSVCVYINKSCQIIVL